MAQNREPPIARFQNRKPGIAKISPVRSPKKSRIAVRQNRGKVIRNCQVESQPINAYSNFVTPLEPQTTLNRPFLDSASPIQCSLFNIHVTKLAWFCNQNAILSEPLEHTIPCKPNSMLETGPSDLSPQTSPNSWLQGGPAFPLELWVEEWACS